MEDYRSKLIMSKTIDNVKYIYFNARFLTQSVSGVQRYAIELLKALDKAITAKEVNINGFYLILLAPKDIKLDLKLKNIELKQVGSFNGHLWEQVELPLYAKNGLLVSLCNTGPILKRRQIITIHDMAEFSISENFSFLFRKSYQLLHIILSKSVKKIISVSNFSKEEIIKYCNVMPEKVIVIYESGDHIDFVHEDRSIIDKNKLLNQPFILAVSSVNPNKNFTSIIKAMELLNDINFSVIIAGKKSHIFSQSDSKCLDKATYVGFVTDQQLKSLYNHASCFIFPSYYEGFGLPPLEAMACGCPVIVSNSAALPEICGDSAIYCDPKDPRDIAIKIRGFLESKSLEESQRLKGYEHSKKYSWNTAAIKTFDLINKVASN
jgi:glycosyltransferase involved in cell wall biosynthesis